ncbi:MAG: helical backbone metal receptor [Bacteroidota bacterium]|nr:helical backbone metal receptor [Bacteroidota bacterium]
MQFKDQTGSIVEVKETPRRIISVVPSQSELLWDLGLRDELIGITKFCIHPNEMFISITRVGGTKKLHIDKIKELNPDIIIANKEENERSDIEELQRHFPVWISDIKNLNDSMNMIHSLGELLGKQDDASRISTKIEEQFSRLRSYTQTPARPSDGKRVAYFIWKNPLMLAGRDTFINDMLQRCGFENCLQDKNSRYPEITSEELKDLNPELILLSSEPYPFSEIHLKEFQQLLPSAKVMVVDGELFSWYGSRLIHSPEYFNQLI